MNRTELVTAVIWLDELAKAAKAEAAKLRADLAADACAELEEQGTAPTWRIPDVATVAASVSHAAVYVDDEDTFTAWVQKRYPTETVVRVRPAWLAGYLQRAVGSVGVVADPDSGEVVPGLVLRRGGDFAGISIRPTSDARAVFAAVAGKSLRELAQSAGPSVPVVLAELEAADVQ